MQLFFLSLLSLAWASPFSTPVGFQEALMGNTGTALVASPGGTIFNPGSLAFMDMKISVSVSGDAVAYQEMQGDTFTEYTGSLQANSLLASAIFEGPEDIRIGLYYTFPGDTTDYFRIVDEGRTFTEELQNSFALGGLVYAKKISASVGSGFAVGLGWSDFDRNAVDRNFDSTSSSLVFQKTREEKISVFLNPGVLWEVSENYSMGFNLLWKALTIYNRGDNYLTRQDSAQIPSTEELTRYTPDVDEYLGMTWGSRFAYEGHEWLLDLSWSNLAPPGLNAFKTRDPYKSISAGWKTAEIYKIHIMSGLQYSSWGGSETFLATGGFSFDTRGLKSNMGLFVQKTQNYDRGGISSDIIGGLYSSGFNY